MNNFISLSDNIDATLNFQCFKRLCSEMFAMRSFRPMAHSPEDVSPALRVDWPEKKVASPRPRVDSPGRRVDSPGLIKSWIILMFCWLNLSNIKHLTFPNLWRYQLTVEFNLSRVYCKRTLPMDCCACSTFSCKHCIGMTETILTF